MFSENNRISGRQVFRLLTYDLLGLSTLLVPPALGRLAGRDGIFCIAAGVAAGLLFLKLLGVVAMDMKEPYPAYLERRLGVIAGRAVQAGYLAYFLLLAGYTAYLFTDVVRKNLLREESFYLVLLVFAALAVYGLWGGIEGRARIYEMLFWFLMIPLFLMLFFSLDEIRTDYWIPVAMAEPAGFFTGSYAVFVCMALTVFVIFAGSYVNHKRSLLRAGKAALVFTGVIHAALYLILVGIFGAPALGWMDYPAVTLMSTVRISGGFLKRADAFMFAVWFFMLYALLNSCVFYGTALLLKLCGAGETKTGQGAEKPPGLEGKSAHPGEKGKSDDLGQKQESASVGEKGKSDDLGQKRGSGWNGRRGEEKKMRLASVILLAAVCILACMCYKSNVWLIRCEAILWYAGTPFLVLVTLLLCARIFFSDRRKRRAAAKGTMFFLTVVLCAGNLAGCASAELEDRNFPIELVVGETQNAALEWLNAGQEGNRVIDYSHLKVIVFERAFMEDASAMEEFLGLLSETDEVPRNTYIVVADDPKEITGAGEDAEEGDTGNDGSSVESAGQYLEQLFENVSPIRKWAYPTLGMLYRERANRCETLFIPYIGMEKGRPVVTQYFVWKRGEPAGTVEKQAALLAYFTGNEMDDYTLALQDGTVVSFSNAQNRIDFCEEDGVRSVLVEICCDGEIKNGNHRGKMRQNAGDSFGQPDGNTQGGMGAHVTGVAPQQDLEEEQRGIEEQTEQYMQELAQTVLREQGIDVSGSYRKLGGIRRDWYAEYGRTPGTYEMDMEIVYRVQIDWVSSVK